MIQPFDNEAIHMLTRANISVVTSDVILLADDLQAVAEELDQSQDDTALAYQAACILKKRIGGYANLESYMRCLRVPNAAR